MKEEHDAGNRVTAVAPLAQKLADKIAAQYPDVRFILKKSGREADTYLLYVLNAPRNEYSVLRLVSEEATDILVEHGVQIIVQPRFRTYTPDILMVSPSGERLAIEIKARKGAA